MWHSREGGLGRGAAQSESLEPTRPPERVQLRRQLAGLSYSAQLEAVRPPPIAVTRATAVQMQEGACEDATLEDDRTVSAGPDCHVVRVRQHFAGLRVPFEPLGAGLDSLPEAHVFEDIFGAVNLPTLILRAVMTSYNYGLGPLRQWAGAASIVARWDQLRELLRDRDDLALAVFGGLEVYDGADADLENFVIEVAETFEQVLQILPEAALRQLVSELQQAHSHATALLGLVFANNAAHPFASWVSEMLSSTDAPTDEMHLRSSRAISRLAGFVDSGDIRAGVEVAQDMARSVNAFVEAVNLYKEGLEEAAGVAVRVCDTTISVALLVIAHWAGPSGAALVPGFVASGLGSAAGTGLRQLLYDQEFDPGAILSSSTRSMLLAGLSGRAAQGVSGRLLPYLSTHITNPAIARRLAGFLGGAGSDLLNSAAREVLHALSGEDVSIDRFLQQLSTRLLRRIAVTAASGDDSFRLRPDFELPPIQTWAPGIV
jgi:hypothetical protein